jgi:phosphoribosylamine--glycine ligase
MRVLIVDTDGCGLAFAKKCKDAGHQVRWFVKPKKTNSPDSGAGICDRVDNWVGSVSWADLIFPTGNDDYLPRLDAFKARGAKVYAPSVKSADLEIKRAQGMLFLEKHGIEVPAYKTFANLKEAEAYVRKKPARYVFKTLGDNEDKSLSYVGKSAADMVARLQRWQKMGMNPKGEVMLQEFIGGVEFAVSRWMGSQGWTGPPNENFEFKKLMPGDLGPNTGEMGTVMGYVESSKLFDQVLAPLEKDLLKLGHLGDIDMNCIVDERGQAWPLEFTCRPGWPAFNIMLSEHKGDPVKWMVDACGGKDTLTVSYDTTIGVVVATPDFPYGNNPYEESSGLPIYGINEKNGKYIHPQEVKVASMPVMKGDAIVESEVWTTAGTYLMVVTGMGSTVKQAADRVYKTLDGISVPNMFYRKDIGARLEKQIPELQKHGFAKHFRYE